MSSQTDLKSDDWCGYNQSASPFFWILEPKQYANTYVFGEVGVSAAGGSAGSYVRPDVIDVLSFLSGRDDMLSKCQPPTPDLDQIKADPLREQRSSDTVNLLPKYTKEKKSAVDLSAIDYNRWQPQDIDPQDLRFIIEDMWAQRGGLDTQNYTKLAWTPGSFNYTEGACNKILDPARACGEFCEPVSGYPGRDFITGQKKTSVAQEYRKPPNEPSYPFKGPYSQDIYGVGADSCGPNEFYGPRYTDGKCPPLKNDMLTETALSPKKFPLKI